MKLLRLKHSELQLIIKAQIDCSGKEPLIKEIKFGLPTKASKLEKYLLKLTNIYAYDVIRYHMAQFVEDSLEFKRLLK